MSRYGEYVQQARSSMGQAATSVPDSDVEGTREVAIAKAHMFALLAVAEAILAAGGQTDWDSE
jgi:hypothetical protein